MEIGGKKLQLEQIEKVLYQNEAIELNESAMDTIRKSHAFLKDFSKDKIIYGINTGFGPMAQYRINEEDQTPLQYNLIRSHSSGTGEKLKPREVKAIMLARLNTLMLGYSGVHENTVELLRDLINGNASPDIFEHGGVGASGDLVQLAHLALFMIGEGQGSLNDEPISAADALKKLQLQPLQIHLREGLALINGTSAMTGIGLINVIHAKKLLGWSVLASAMINEVVESFDDHFSKELNYSKLHSGQRQISDRILEVLKTSKRIKHRRVHLYDQKIDQEYMKEKVQEYYSLRCVPQILGPVVDTLEYTEKILLEEISSANDNPIIDLENENVYHGGNFHGDYIGLEMDKLKIAVTKLTMLAERQLNHLLNDKLNEKLPPFINLGRLGYNFGMQGMQFTATSTTAESQTYSYPMYVHSIPNNNDNQDIVSMGTNAALICKKVVENAFEVVAIGFIGLAQAIDYLEIENQLSEPSRKMFNEVRKVIPRFEDDQPRSGQMKQIKDYLKKNHAGI